MNFKILFLLFVIGFSFQSCDLGTEPEIGGTNTRKMAGEWYVQLLDGDGNVLVDYSPITMSNTAANLATEMWLVDNSIFGAQTKLTTDQTALTFVSQGSGDNIGFGGDADAPEGKPVVPLGTIEEVESDSYKSLVVTDGRILKDAARPPSNTVTDSIMYTATGNYAKDIYTAISYSIVNVGGVPDTTVIWEKASSELSPDGPYFLRGYRRTGFLEDEH